MARNAGCLKTSQKRFISRQLLTPLIGGAAINISGEVVGIVDGGFVGKFDNNLLCAYIYTMKATLLFKQRIDFDDGAMIEIVVWSLPKPVVGSLHHFKYRLFYGFAGERIIGYDNERPKGDHCHRDNVEMPYQFISPERLIDDFLNAVNEIRSQP